MQIENQQNLSDLREIKAKKTESNHFPFFLTI